MLKQLLLLFLTGAFFKTGFSQNVGIGTTTPSLSYKLHVHGGSSDISIGITNGFTTDALLRGTRLRAIDADFTIINQEITGNIGLATGGFQRMTVAPNGSIGIGTINPTIANLLHVHGASPATDASIGITNSFTTDADLRGVRLRMNAYDFSIANYESTGKIRMYTGGLAGLERFTILPSGFIGINQPNPTQLLHLEATSNYEGIFINHTGSNTSGMRVLMSGSSTNTMAINTNCLNNSDGSFYAYGIRASSGNGGTQLGQNSNYGVVGENLNTAQGTGVFGGTSAPSGVFYTHAGVVGFNWSNSITNAFGVIGKSSGLSGAGTAGITFSPGAVGVLGTTETNDATGIRAEVKSGFSGTALEIANGPLKVSGTNRTVFQHTATAGNTSGNETIISTGTLANSATDMLIVTPYWDGVYLNAPIGVYFSSGSWRIFRQDLGTMPLNAKFNILVVKQ